jgi:hypothetical protein
MMYFSLCWDTDSSFWAMVCRPKEYGGLGILDTKNMNIALMVGWIWELKQNAEGQ